MSILKSYLNFSYSTQISVKKQVKKEKVLVNKIIPHPNHKIWEINDNGFTTTIELAKFEEKSFIIGKNHKNKEIIINKDCIYISAMNKENAMKKYWKGVNGSKKLGSLEIKLF